MGYTELTAGREALHAQGESYKGAVRRYLVSKGYTVVSDSSIQGHLADLIVSDAQEKTTWVETKDTELSLKNASFGQEVIDYYQAWRALEPGKRPTMMIFARKFVAKANWQAIFQNYEDQSLGEWVDWLVKKVPKASETGLGEDAATFREFLASTDVFSATGQRLADSETKLIEQARQDWQAIGQERLERAKRQDAPLAKKSTIVTNCIPVTPPEQVYEYKTKFRKVGEVYREFRGYPVPPFYLSKGSLYSFEEPLEHNPFVGEATETIAHKRSTLETEYPQLIRNLIQRQAEGIAKANGLWWDGRALFMPIRHGDEEARIATSGKTSIKMGSLMRHQEAHKDGRWKEGDINYGLHESIRFSARQMDSGWVLLLRIGRTYTEDGRQVIEDGESRDRIDRTLRFNPTSRNAARHGKLKAWAEGLFTAPPEVLDGANIADEERVHWLKALSPKGLASSEVPWSPEAADRTFAPLEAYDAN